MCTACKCALMARRSSNPLPNWKQGVDPDQSGPEPEDSAAPEPSPDYSVHNADFMLMLRATRIVRQRYGIQPGDFSRWTPRHDKEAMNVLQALREGQPVQRNEYREPPQIDPWATLLPRSSSR